MLEAFILIFAVGVGVGLAIGYQLAGKDFSKEIDIRYKVIDGLITERRRELTK